MERQNMSVIKRFPKDFNIGMILDMNTNFAPTAVDPVVAAFTLGERS